MKTSRVKLTFVSDGLKKFHQFATLTIEKPEYGRVPEFINDIDLLITAGRNGYYSFSYDVMKVIMKFLTNDPSNFIQVDEVGSDDVPVVDTEDKVLEYSSTTPDADFPTVSVLVTSNYTGKSHGISLSLWPSLEYAKCSDQVEKVADAISTLVNEKLYFGWVVNGSIVMSRFSCTTLDLGNKQLTIYSYHGSIVSIHVKIKHSSLAGGCTELLAMTELGRSIHNIPSKESDYKYMPA